MPRKINKRKAIQAAKNKAKDAEEARKNKRWPTTRRAYSDDAPRQRIGIIAHHHKNMSVLASLLIAAQADLPDATKGTSHE